jgi:hypothetical protein
MKKTFLLLICLIACCGKVCCPKVNAELNIEIKQPNYNIKYVNPSDSEVLRGQAIQNQQVMVDLANKGFDAATKGCNKKSLLKRIFNVQ